jgi:hypothetical protein
MIDKLIDWFIGVSEDIICNIHVGMLSIFILGTSDDSHGTTHRAAHHISMSQIGTASWQGGYLSASAHMVYCK